MGFRDKFREKATSMGMKQMTPSETAVGQELAKILTTTEYELFAALDRLVRAADAGRIQVDQSIEDRRDEILDVADAVAAQEFQSWWWDEYGAEQLDDVQDARDHVGLDKEEWRKQIETWAENYRESAAPDHPVHEKTDAQIAAFHVEQKFDVDLATFAQEVVEWSAAEHVEGIVRRNLRESIETIHAVASELEDKQT